ncbi:hypothetical protein SRHO_G00085360 [Serrasalmus rhombeus]
MALNRYKAEPSICMEACPLQWWSTHARAHQELFVLARKYLASPATSVPCERLFSLAASGLDRQPRQLLKVPSWTKVRGHTAMELLDAVTMSLFQVEHAGGMLGMSPLEGAGG